MSVQISDEDDLITSEQSPRFKKVPTLAAAITQIVLCLAQIILVFLLPSLYDRHNSGVHSFGSFSLLIYTHGAHWAAFLIIDQFLHYHHHKSRLQGYLEFYVRTKNIRRAPFYILSVGNAVLMIVVMILHDLCDSNSSCSHTFTKVDYLRGLITLESPGGHLLGGLLHPHPHRPPQQAAATRCAQGRPDLLHHAEHQPGGRDRVPGARPDDGGVGAPGRDDQVSPRAHREPWQEDTRAYQPAQPEGADGLSS
eukprot:TRINITY_DN7986_c0_g1_i2.p1 TRINITY_DN7986_c0_g1~~TRINITY_DN7986_c0_g1_i2.p1  ORF type:complete len:252 (+),score=63.57 TRINITY_DN7986_c0_g1_i2:136-891(+)